MIAAYPARASVLPGERLVLHVSTDRPRFRLHCYRWGQMLEPVLRTGWLRGRRAPPRGPGEDWDWPRYAIDIPAHWNSAVYLVRCEAEGTPPAAPWMPEAAALFVVRGAGAGRLLVKLPLATWHAYNHSGGGCFYDQPPRSDDPPGARLSLRRPGGGTGGAVFGAPDHYDARSPRQSFAHWDGPFIRWLLRNGYQPEFCTDFDLHADPGLCRRYRLLAGAGHDEYWSGPTRDHVEAFIADGGNAAFFGANLCWWRIHYVDDGRAMVCHQGGPRGARDHWWPAGGVGRPEDALGGASYRHGGGWWDGPRRAGGYVVHDADHWVYAGTGLRRGDVFGADTRPPLIGYECDGAPLEMAHPLPRLARDAAACGTPAGYRLLASSVLGPDWQELPARERHAAGEGVHAACMGIYTAGGTVFSAGTTDWAQVLDGGASPCVERITANVLDRLLSERGAR
nr:N,N-dimethylformamidase beta subunit family domain-containing protein [uncultured Duganella sp.]